MPAIFGPQTPKSSKFDAVTKIRETLADVFVFLCGFFCVHVFIFAVLALLALIAFLLQPLSL